MSFKLLAAALLSGKPYSGSAFRAMQGPPERQQYFLPVVKHLVMQSGREDVRVLEIGSWAGVSTISWALAVREAADTGTVSCVDPWLPYFDLSREHQQHYRDMNDAAEDDLICRLFEHNIQTAGVADLVQVHRGGSREMLPGLPAQEFDVIYIDGSHRFEDVAYDIQEAKRLLRRGGIICGDDLEVQAGALNEEELAEATTAGYDLAFSERLGTHYHPGVTRAVGAAFSTVGVWGGFWAVEQAGDAWRVPALDLKDLRLPAHIARSPDSQIVDSTPTYNFVAANGRFFAIAKSVGSVDLFAEHLGDRELAPILLAGDSLEEVRRKTLVPATLSPDASKSIPVLIGTHRQFNLVSWKGRVWAFRQALGNIDLAIGESEIEDLYGAESVLYADSVDVLKARIEAATALGDVASLAAVVAELRSSVATGNVERQSEIAALRAAADNYDGLIRELRTKLTNTIGQINVQQRSLNGTLAATRQTVAELRSRMEAESVACDSDLTGIRETIKDLGEQIRLQSSSVSAAILSQAHGIDRVHQEIEEVRRRLPAIEEQCRLLTRRADLSEYGPGDPKMPCVAREHRGFSLVHYQGRVYALRKPLDPGEVCHGEYELQIRHGQDVVVGDSLDGVCARIDVQEDMKELHAQMAGLDGELLAARDRLGADLQRTQAELQTLAKDLDRLASSWPLRLLRASPKQ